MRRSTNILFMVCTLVPFYAYAGAWTLPEGNSQAIITSSHYQTDSFSNTHGERQSQPTYSKQELSTYLEHGMQDGLTIAANLALQRTHQAPALGSTPQTNWGVGDTEIMLRKRLLQYGGFIVSAEPMIKLPSPESPDNQPRIGSSHPDAGLGLSTGYDFIAYGRKHYADLTGQYRYRFGRPEDQIKLSATLGVGIAPRWTIMPQAFFTWRTNTPRNPAFTQSSADDYDLIKFQLSGLYQVTDDIAVQLGGFQHIDGKNVGRGGGGILAVWKQF